LVSLTAAAELAIGAAMVVLLYRDNRTFALDPDGE